MISIGANDYVACLCEGMCEMTIIDILLKQRALIFSKEQLLDGQILPPKYYRSADKFCSQYLAMDYGSSKVAVLAIQDRKIAYRIDSPYSDKVLGPYQVVTAPEIEMLMIHSLDLYESFKGQRKKPSIFLAETLGIMTAALKNSKYLRQFYGEHDLMEAVRMHKKKAPRLSGNQIFMADLLK